MKEFPPGTQFAIWQKWLRAGNFAYRVAWVEPGLDMNDPANQHPFGPTFNDIAWANKYRDQYTEHAKFRYPTGGV